MTTMGTEHRGNEISPSRDAGAKMRETAIQSQAETSLRSHSHRTLAVFWPETAVFRDAADCVVVSVELELSAYHVVLSNRSL
jgi:hypothetical protein